MAEELSERLELLERSVKQAAEAIAALRKERDGLSARVAQLEKEAAEYKDQWLRAAADFKNFKRRTEQERADHGRGDCLGISRHSVVGDAVVAGEDNRANVVDGLRGADALDGRHPDAQFAQTTKSSGRRRKPRQSFGRGCTDGGIGRGYCAVRRHRLAARSRRACAAISLA